MAPAARRRAEAVADKGEGAEELVTDGKKEAQAGTGKQQREHGALPPALRAPAHVIARVFSQLDCIDLLHCSLACKQWYRDSAELREGWKNEYIEAWNFYGLCIKRETHPPSSTCSIRGVHSWCP